MFQENPDENNIKKNDFLQSPEKNWDDIVNNEMIQNQIENSHGNDQIYNNLSKINKNLMFNSDSKVPINQNYDGFNKKQVKFETGGTNSEKESPVKDKQYFKKLKTK